MKKALLQVISIFITLISLLCPGLFGQTLHESAIEEGENARWEIVLSGLTFFEKEEGIPDEYTRTFGTELHITYWLSHRWALGGSYTLKSTGENMYGSELAIIGSFKPQKWLTINAGPDFALPDSSPESELELFAYLEAEFNFFIKENFHLGPVVGGLVANKTEVFAGLHLGFEF